MSMHMIMILSEVPLPAALVFQLCKVFPEYESQLNLNSDNGMRVPLSRYAVSVELSAEYARDNEDPLYVTVPSVPPIVNLYSHIAYNVILENPLYTSPGLYDVPDSSDLVFQHLNLQLDLVGIVELIVIGGTPD